MFSPAFRVFASLAALALAGFNVLPACDMQHSSCESKCTYGSSDYYRCEDACKKEGSGSSGSPPAPLPPPPSRQSDPAAEALFDVPRAAHVDPTNVRGVWEVDPKRYPQNTEYLPKRIRVGGDEYLAAVKCTNGDIVGFRVAMTLADDAFVLADDGVGQSTLCAVRADRGRKGFTLENDILTVERYDQSTEGYVKIADE